MLCSASIQPREGLVESVNSPTDLFWRTFRRLAATLAGALMLVLGGAAFAQAFHHGGYGGAPHMTVPHGGYERMAPWSERPAPPWGRPMPGYAPRGYPMRPYAPERPYPVAHPYPAMRSYPPVVRGYRAPAPPGGGYYMGGRWYYGPPEVGRAPAPGALSLRRGGYLPPAYQSSVVPDYGRYHLRRPPFGYNWVRAGNKYLLVSSSTGLIFDEAPGY